MLTFVAILLFLKVNGIGFFVPRKKHKLNVIFISSKYMFQSKNSVVKDMGTKIKTNVF
jgi:hypothetical protein